MNREVEVFLDRSVWFDGCRRVLRALAIGDRLKR